MIDGIEKEVSEIFDAFRGGEIGGHEMFVRVLDLCIKKYLEGWLDGWEKMQENLKGRHD